MDTADLDSARHLAAWATPLLKVLANKNRVLLLMQLARSECDVKQLGERLLIKQPTLSQQLAIVRRAGLVSARREGKKIYYRTVNVHALKLISLMNILYRNPAIGTVVTTEREAKTSTSPLSDIRAHKGRPPLFLPIRDA